MTAIRCRECNEIITYPKCLICGTVNSDRGHRGVLLESDSHATPGHMELKKTAVDILLNEFGFRSEEIDMEAHLPLNYSGVMDVLAVTVGYGPVDRIAFECVNSGTVEDDSKTAGARNAPKLGIDVFYLTHEGVYTVTERNDELDVSRESEYDEYVSNISTTTTND